MILGYPRSDMVLGVESSTVKVKVKGIQQFSVDSNSMNAV